MGIRIQRLKAVWLGSLMAALLLISGCAGMEPYEPRDIRVEGMEHGVFTGSEGEFVVFSKGDKSETGSESGKKPDSTADDEQ